jgi:endo-1,4-beta-xylanase
MNRRAFLKNIGGTPAAWLISPPAGGADHPGDPGVSDGFLAQVRPGIDLYALLFAHPAVHALTWWDFSDRGAWQGAAAGLVRQDMSPKPAYERLRELIKGEWWTRAEGR